MTEAIEDRVSKLMTSKKIRRYSEPGNRRVVRRPEEILRDVRGLKLRQRVSLVLNDGILREELEEIYKDSTANGASRLDTLRTFQDLLLPTHQPGLVSLGAGSGSTVLPINDLRGEAKLAYKKTEIVGRCKLAALYRLVDLMGWSEGIFNHISFRLSKDKEEFLINPFGLLYSEVSASSLLTVDLEGSVKDPGSTSLGINRAGYVLHSTIHEARPDINCVIHVHTPDAVAISSMKCGFLRISQESLIIGHVSYHDYCGILIDEEEKQSLKNDLGPNNLVMFLRNHGVVVCGKDIESAHMLLCTLMDACNTQVKAMCAGIENLNIISDEAFTQVQMVYANQSSIKMGTDDKMSLSEYYFEAYMRWMDAQGYRTGYPYHIPDVFLSAKKRTMPESMVPPQVTSDRDYITPFHSYAEYTQSSPARRAHSIGKGNTYRNRVKWLNSPVQGTVYCREDTPKTKSVLEVGKPTLSSNELNCTLESNESNSKVTAGIEPTGAIQVNQSNDVTIVKSVVATTEIVAIIDEDISHEEKTCEVESTKIEWNANDVVPVNDTVNSQPTINCDSVEGGSQSPFKSLGDGNLSPPSNSSSISDLADRNDGSLSPSKVKKKASFKKGLMKKFNKKGDKKESTK